MRRIRGNRIVLSLALALAILVVGLVPSAGSGGPPVAGKTAADNAAAAATRMQVRVLHVYFHDNAERDRLAQELGAEEAATTDGYLTIIADPDLYANIVARGLRFDIDANETARFNDPHLFGDTFYNGYKTVEEMQTYLDTYVAAYPTLAQKVPIGQSWCATHTCTQPNNYNGYTLYALHITNQAIAGPKPVFWYDAGIHSREIATPEIAMRYIAYLLDGYNNDADAHWLVDYHDIWVMPMFNPDGHHIVEAGGGGSSPYYQRKNANNTNGCTQYPPSSGSQFGTDNNRNFPFLWNCCGGSSSAPCSQTYHGTGGASDPETQAVVNQVRLLIPDQRGPLDTDPAPITTTGVYQNMHSNAALNLYPWGQYTSPAPNGPELANLGQHLKATNAYPSGNNYQTCQPGNCLYIVDGDANDWAYGELGALSFTTELGGSDFLVPLSYVDSTLWPANRGPLIYQAKVARQPYLITHGPDAVSPVTNPMTVTQGTPSALTGTINYAWTGNSFSQNVAAAEYYIDTPPWAGGTAIPLAGTFSSPTVAVSDTIDTSALTPGRHIIFVRGRGATPFQGYATWGPISATWLTVTAPAGSPTPTATDTAVPTATSTAVPTTTNTAVPTVSNTAVPTVANTTVPTASATAAAATVTATTQVTVTPTLAPPTGSPTATPCTIRFSDVTDATAYYYQGVYYLACRNVLSGYADGTFKPFNTTTRGQMTKIVTLGFGLPTATPAPGGTFADVLSDNVFYGVIETAAARGIVSGYTCGGVNPQTGTAEPCDSNRRAYFRPSNSVTRGQLTKIVVSGAGWTLRTPATPTFSDVAVNNVFYPFIETAVCHGVITGYSDGTFRSNANAFRGQIAKIVYLALTNPQACAP